jgi:hypothetical protein
MTVEEWKRLEEELKSFHGLDCATRDERLAHVFLAGCIWKRELTVKGRVKRKVQLHYLQGGKQVAKGREALIRVLEQSNLPSFLVHDLAVLFDDKVRKKAVLLFWPEEPEGLRGTVVLMNETRKLKFVYRLQKPHDPLQDNEIRSFMHPSEGKRPRVKDAMRFFGLSRQAIYDALKRAKRSSPHG